MFKPRISLFLALALLSDGAFALPAEPKAAASPPAPVPQSPAAAAKPKASPPQAEPPQTAPPPSAAKTPAKPESIPEKAALCQQFEGKYLAYYELVFKVQGCKRYALDTAEIYELSRQGIVPYDKRKEMPKIIQALPFGGTWGNEVSRQSPVNPCTAYDHLYVTDGVEVYWVNKCQLQLFPDWASYESHRGSLSKNPPTLRYLDSKQLAQFKEGKDLPSVIDEEYRELEEPKATLTPAEACKGLLGTFVSYLDTIYFIEAHPKGCKRRPVDGEEFTRNRANDKHVLQELTSAQAQAILEGNKYKLSGAK
jgi:hypothetical protein